MSSVYDVCLLDMDGDAYTCASCVSLLHLTSLFHRLTKIFSFQTIESSLQDESGRVKSLLASLVCF